MDDDRDSGRYGSDDDAAGFYSYLENLGNTPSGIVAAFLVFALITAPIWIPLGVWEKLRAS
jgi:hypothetical protein